MVERPGLSSNSTILPGALFSAASLALLAPQTSLLTNVRPDPNIQPGLVFGAKVTCDIECVEELSHFKGAISLSLSNCTACPRYQA